MTWINVNDKLPSTIDKVLVVDSYEDYHIAIYDKEYRQWFTEDEYPFHIITHWMPIPKYVKTT
jgi:hypothetical protein